MSKNAPISAGRDKWRTPNYSGMCAPEPGPYHAPHPTARRPYPSPNRRNFRDVVPGPCCSPCQSVTSTPRFMRRPSDQIYNQESPEGTSEDEEKERRRSPAFRRTPGASRPRNARPGFFPPHMTHPGFGPMWEASPKSFLHQPTSGSSAGMLHASDLCRGGGGGGGGGESSQKEQEDDNGGGGVSEPRSLTGGSVELRINNLDYNISAREWKKILIAEFVEHVKVLDAFIQTQADNTNVGYIRLGSIDEARFAISKLHRKKVGYKRIHVSLVDDESNTSAPNARFEVVGLLKEVSDNSLPLFKFIDLFEKRFHRGISVSELYRMRSIIQIEDREGSGRTVSLMPTTPPPSQPTEDDQDEDVWLESPVCPVHCSEGSPTYAAAMDAECLPNVITQLKTFSAQVHTLLQTHEGNMPLMSFQCCHEAEFQKLPLTEDGGVPVEHLISCVPGVKVAITRSGIKKIQWAENKPTGPVIKSSPLMSQTLSQFGREVVDLLKNAPQCRISFVKFIPAYHHHFGRQCRVADYGYTKLMELLEAIPHVVQVISSGSRRVVMLSHRSQVKRFVTDILRVLKSQTSKQINVTDLPIVYNNVIGRPFCITDYGVCFIEDMLCEIPESTVQVQGIGQEMIILIPRKEQTLAELERTQQFAVEVMDLLRHSPHCRMSFNKFIPAYHHHFGKQCRVANYGFVKLLDLFESIPHIVQIEEEEEDKVLCLMNDELFKVLEDQVTALLWSRTNQELPVPEFLTAFMRLHGHSLRLQDYGVSSVSGLIKQIPETAKIEQSQSRAVIRLVDHVEERQQARRVLLLLMDQVDARLSLEDICSQYKNQHGDDLSLEDITKLSPYIQIYEDGGGKGKWVKLTALQMFARDMRTLLLANKGRLSLQHIEPVFAQHFGVALVPSSYGCPSLHALIQSVPLVISLRGKGYRRMVFLTPEFQNSESSDTTQWQSVCNPTPTTSPSGDSGITDCHGLSPSHDRLMFGESMASPILDGKSGVPDPGSHYDHTNGSIPGMLSTYSDDLNAMYVDGTSPEGLAMTSEDYEAQAQYGLCTEYVAYTHDSSYLQPSMVAGGGEGFYSTYPTYNYIHHGGQFETDEGAVLSSYNHHDNSSPLEYTGEFMGGCEPGVIYMVEEASQQAYTSAPSIPDSKVKIEQVSDGRTDAKEVQPDVGATSCPIKTKEELAREISPSLETASAKLKNLLLSAPPPQLATKTEPWVSALHQIEETHVDGDVDVNNNASIADMNRYVEAVDEKMTSPGDAIVSPVPSTPTGKNDSGCEEDVERDDWDEELTTSKLPASPRKPRLAARFNTCPEKTVSPLATAPTSSLSTRD